MGVVTKFQEMAISSLTPYENNAKIHTDEQIDKLMRSIKEFGFISPCVIDKERNLIAGHGRVMAANKLGMTEVPCVFVEGLSDEQRRAYILADNRLSELALWDKELISTELELLRAENFDITITGFDVDDIIMEDDGTFELDDDFEDLNEIETEYGVKEGDVYKLGDHTLMCGDSTKLEDVQALVGGGDY